MWDVGCVIGFCDRKWFFFFLGMGPNLPAQSHANPRTNQRDRETNWLNPGHEPTSLAEGWAAGTMESKWR